VEGGKNIDTLAPADNWPLQELVDPQLPVQHQPGGQPGESRIKFLYS
jgi:hypothetical protein